jgi:MFS family permease
MSISFLFLACGIPLYGPSELLGFPNKIYILIIGYFIMGVAQAFLYIPLVPEIIDSVIEKEEIIECECEQLDSAISDRAAALYGTFYSAGIISAPLLGAVVYDIVTD